MTLFASKTPPDAWQRALGERIAQALALARRAHPAASDGAAPALRSWRVAAAPEPSAPRALAGGQALMQQIFERCLVHYREQLQPRSATRDDDVLAALACFLCACVQAIEGHPVTPERWRAAAQWLSTWVLDGEPQRLADTAAQQRFFERMAVLSAALGEWSVQASRQGDAAMASARLMAAQHLQHELGVAADALLQAWRCAGLIDGNSPSWGRAELPKAPTGRGGARRL